MIAVSILPLERNNGIYRVTEGFLLPEIGRSQDTIRDALLYHPLRSNTLTSHGSFSIISRITIGGIDYNAQPPWAKIDYQNFLSNRDSPINLDFHLLKYLGDLSEYPYDCPAPDMAVKKGINWPNFSNVLLHEFSHLIDALHPAFRYDSKIQRSLDQEQRYQVESLWNSYINFRLRRALGAEFSLPETQEESQFDFSSACSYLNLLEMTRKKELVSGNGN